MKTIEQLTSKTLACEQTRNNPTSHHVASRRLARVSWISRALSLQGRRLKLKAQKLVISNFGLFMHSKIRRRCAETWVFVLSWPKPSLGPDMHSSPGVPTRHMWLQQTPWIRETVEKAMMARSTKCFLVFSNWTRSAPASEWNLSYESSSRYPRLTDQVHGDVVILTDSQSPLHTLTTRWCTASLPIPRDNCKVDINSRWHPSQWWGRQTWKWRQREQQQMQALFFWNQHPKRNNWEMETGDTIRG